MKRKILFLMAVLFLCSFLTACEEVQWFKTDKDERLQAYEDNEIEPGKYYIKQGTRFYKVFNNKEGALQYKSTSVNGKRVIPLTVKNEIMVPSHYINEGIAYKSDKDIIKEVNMERFMDLGYSIGLYNGEFDDTGYLYFNRDKCLVKNSSIAEIVNKSASDDIRLISINGEKITPQMIDIESGVIPDLEENKSYKVQLYMGTTFVEYDVIADTRMLKSFEVFSYDNSLVTFTQNGYVIFNTPNDLKSGYYVIGDAGLFKYYDHEKGQMVDADTDMNVSYYEDEQSMLEAQSRQYTVDIPNKVKDLAIVVDYSIPYTYDESENNIDVKGYVFGPDKTKYFMEKDDKEHTLTLNMTEALPGEWTVNITPKTVEIKDVKVDSTKVDEEATLKTKDFTFAEDQTNVRFKCDIVSSTGEEDVYGYITSPDGRTYDMIYEYDKNKKTGKIYYDSPFVLSGLWTVKIYYHPTVTELGEIETSIETETDVDIIIIGD